MKQSWGMALVVFGGIFFALFIAASTIYRFSNPALTETQLALWALSRWWGWAVPLAMIGLGQWMSRSR